MDNNIYSEDKVLSLNRNIKAIRLQIYELEISYGAAKVCDEKENMEALKKQIATMIKKQKHLEGLLETEIKEVNSEKAE